MPSNPPFQLTMAAPPPCVSIVRCRLFSAALGEKFSDTAFMLLNLYMNGIRRVLSAKVKSEFFSSIFLIDTTIGLLSVFVVSGSVFFSSGVLSDVFTRFEKLLWSLYMSKCEDSPSIVTLAMSHTPFCGFILLTFTLKKLSEATLLLFKSLALNPETMTLPSMSMSDGVCVLPFT